MFGPVEKLTAEYWPGTPVVPVMSAGATDGAFLTPAGIPTYGVSGIFRRSRWQRCSWTERAYA